MFTSAWQEVIFPLPKSCVCKSRGKQEGFRLFYTGTWGKSHWFMPHGDTCSTLTQGHMFTKWRSQWTKYNMQLCQLVKDRVKEKLETLNIFTNSGGVTGNARRSSRAWNHEHHYFESWIENHTKSQSKKKKITGWPLSLCAFQITSGHTPDETVDGVLGDPFSNLDYELSSLLGSVWCYLSVSFILIHNITEDLNWILF